MKFFSKLIPDKILLKDMAKNKGQIDVLLQQYKRNETQIDILEQGRVIIPPSQMSATKTSTVLAQEQRFNIEMGKYNQTRTDLVAQIKGLQQQMETDAKNLRGSTAKKEAKTLIDATRTSIQADVSANHLAKVEPLKIAKKFFRR